MGKTRQPSRSVSQRLLEVAKTAVLLCAETKALGLDPTNLLPLVTDVRDALNNLPVDSEGIKPHGWMGFILSRDSWYPVHAFDEITHGVLNGGINYRLDYSDGSSEGGPTQPYAWAHCTADNTVNFHHLDELIEHLESEVRACGERAAAIAVAIAKAEAGEGEPVAP